MTKNVIIIAGPTASGKSGLAMELAARLNGAVVNADSMQVYSSFPILSAQPDDVAKATAPHHLYGYVTPPYISDAASWRRDTMKAIDEIHANGCTPILVGGTGLYLEALMHGISEIPDVPDDVREKAAAEFTALGGAALREKLIAADADAAQLMPSDKQRIIRAYSVLLQTGKPIGYWQRAGLQTPPQDWAFKSILIMPERERLYATIDARFLEMIKLGAVEEVKATFPSPHPSQKALGVRELQAFLQGEIKLENAIEKAQQFSRNYAKRQITWFNGRFLKKEAEVGRTVEILGRIDNAIDMLLPSLREGLGAG